MFSSSHTKALNIKPDRAWHAYLSLHSSAAAPSESQSRLSGLRHDFVEEFYGIGDTVEGQNTCTVIQVHSHPGGPGTRDRGSSVVIPEVVAIFETV